MKNILITGGTGYIGQYIAMEMKKQGYNVFITSRKNMDVINGFSNRNLDLLDASTMDGICAGMDIIIHTANMDERLLENNPKEALIANAFATRQLYMDAKNCGVKKFIYLSTFHVYGVQCGEVFEDTVRNPKTEYGLTHFFAEEYLKKEAKDMKCNVSIVRLTNGIGVPLKDTDKWYLVFNDFCKTIYDSQTVIMKSNGLPLRDFVAIKDVVSAMLLLSNYEADNIYEVFNLSAGKTYSIRQVAELVADIYEKRYLKKVVLNIPQVTEEEIKQVKKLYVDSGKLKKLGWTCEYEVEDVINEIFDCLDKRI